MPRSRLLPADVAARDAGGEKGGGSDGLAGPDGGPDGLTGSGGEVAGPPVRTRPDRLARLSWRAVLALAAIVPAAVLVVFFVYPVGSIVGRGLIGPEGFDARAAWDVLGRTRTLRIIGFTVAQAAASTVLALALGLPAAYVTHRTSFRGRTLVRALITVPFVLPTVVVGLAFRTLLAPRGWLGGLGWDGTVWAILAAHVFFNLAVVVRTVGGVWAHLDERAGQAARSLGAGPVRVLCTVTLPALGPAIAAAATMVFLFCATSFGVILVLGGGITNNTIETEIYRQTAQVGDLRAAAVLSIVQILLVTAVLLAAHRLRGRTEATLRLAPAEGGARRLRPIDLPALAVTLATVAGILLPLAILLVRSLTTPDGFGLDNYLALAGVGEGNVLLVSGTTALVNSLRSAALAAALATALAILLSTVLARRPQRPGPRRLVAVFDGLMMAPLGVSAVTVGFGFLIALDRPPLDLRSSPLIVPIAQALIATPLVVRMILPLLRAADERLRSAAAVLGAGPARVWASVDMPIVARALAGAAGFAFAVGLGEFGATTFVARPETITLPVVIGRLITRPGTVNTGMALAAGVLLALLCALVVLLVDLAASRGGRGGAIGGF